VTDRTRIVNTDNFAGDYPNETYVNIPPLPYEENEIICEFLNRGGSYAPRYYKVVPLAYTLDDEQFEP
jgi:hypothetical protein